MHPVIQSWLIQSTVIFLVIGSIAGMVVGAMLIFGQKRLIAASAMLDRWISMRRLDRPLERRVTLDPVLYRHRYPFGMMILAGAVFTLYFFSVQLDRAEMVSALARHLAYPQTLVEVLLDTMVFGILFGGLAAIVVALFILFRPSMMRDFEEGANDWFSLRKALRPMEIPRDGLQVYVDCHSRQIGIFLMLGGLYTLVMLLLFMAR